MGHKHKCDQDGKTRETRDSVKNKVIVYLETFCSVCGVLTAKDKIDEWEIPKNR